MHTAVRRARIPSGSWAGWGASHHRVPPPLTRPLLRGIRANAAWPMHGQRGYCPCARAGVGTCRARACAYTSVLEYVDARSAVARVGRSPVSFQRIWARV